MEKFIDGLINGLSMGSVFALIALGYSMVYGIAKMINFAHGEFIVVGGFTIYGVAKLLGATPLTSIICLLAGIIASVVIAVLAERFAYRPLRKKSKSRITALITAIGVSYLLYGIFNLISDRKLIPPTFFDFANKTQKMLLLLGVTAVCLILLTLFVQKSKLGKATRAVSENPDAAKLMGINNDFIISLTFAIGAMIAAISAFLYYIYNDKSMKFSDGTEIIGLIPFAAAVVGGIGSLPGAVIGGFMIGLIQEFCAIYQISGWTPAIIYGVLVLVLLIKPSGILGKNQDEKV